MYRAALFILALLLAPQVSASVNLVVSIKPLQLIAQFLTGESGTVRTLVPESGSPHHYTMTPSDRLALETADLIIYVGEELETELHEAVRGLNRDQALLELLSAPGIQPRNLANTDQLDPHIWLQTENGLKIAAAIRDRISLIDPALAAHVRENYRQLEQDLRSAKPIWQQRIQNLPAVHYAVYHDAISYFESEFDRRHSIVLVDDPEVQPGIRHLLNVRRSIDSLQPVCLFADVTARQNTIDTLFANREIRQQVLDLMGDGLPAGAGYLELIDHLVTDFSRCLGGEDYR